MTLSIKQFSDVVGTGQSFACTIDLSGNLRYGVPLFPNLLAVEGTVANRAGIVTLHYQITGDMPYECDRCLMQCKLDINKEFEHIVVNHLEDEGLDDVFILCPDGQLDLLEIVSSDLTLSLPSVLLCRDNCKGLCSECGTNLNNSDCGCVKDTTDPRLAILKTLLEN